MGCLCSKESPPKIQQPVILNEVVTIETPVQEIPAEKQPPSQQFMEIQKAYDTENWSLLGNLIISSQEITDKGIEIDEHL